MSDTRPMMQGLAKQLDDKLNPERAKRERENGFVLLVFPFGTVDGPRCNYVSNGADRKEIVCLMKEMIARFEGQADIAGRA